MRKADNLLHIGRRFGLDQNLVLHAAQGFDKTRGIKQAITIEIVLDFLLHHLLAIDGQLLVSIDDLVARQTDHALDVVERWVRRIAEYHHVAALRRVHFDYFLVDHRQAHAVGVLVHQDEIAHQQGRDHRAGGNLEGLHEK